jgi:hypothetical protein
MQDESNEPKGPVERGVRRDLPFLGLLSPEKTEAIMRGERVQITAEEAGVFRAQMNLIHDRERDLMRWGLQWMLNNLHGIDHEWAKEACNIARQALGGA